MIIDCHSHVFPKSYIDILVRYSVYPKVEPEGPDAMVYYGDIQSFRLNSETYSPESKIQMMDRCKIDVSLISCNIPDPCMLPDEVMVEGARALNDEIGEIARPSVSLLLCR